MPPTEVRGISRPILTTLFLGFVFAAGASRLACPAVKAAPAELRLRVFVTNAARVPVTTLQKAQEIASRVYQNAGIGLNWRGCPAGGESPELYPDCQGPFGPLDLFLKILPVSNAGLTPQESSFGVALIASRGFSGTAYINFDRVDKWTWERLRARALGRFLSLVPAGDRCALMLGMVMAHELGHLLLGSQSHSARGIMRPQWSLQQLEDVYEGRQGFTSDEKKRLWENVQARISGVPLSGGLEPRQPLSFPATDPETR